MEKVVVGMSGGVDSAVCAYLLKQRGYEVIGVTMQIWQEAIPDGNGGQKIAEIDDAKQIAAQLGIKHFVLPLKQCFRENIVSYFIDSYNNGRTPNPCIRCNQLVKWQALLQFAEQSGAEYVATGHYAKIKRLENGRYSVSNATSIQKDQTYVLFNLTQNQLKRTIMPLGDYEKSEIRKIAEESGIVVAHKKDSQDMCFVPDGRYANFIWKETGERAIPGNIVDVYGNVLGKHKGIIFYTLGQRKGLRLKREKKMFVKEIRPATNEIVVSEIEGLYTKELYAEKINFMGIEKLHSPMKVFAKIRYSHKGAEGIIEQVGEDTVKCIFDEPQRAITPGQGFVAYDFEGNILLGGEIK